MFYQQKSFLRFAFLLNEELQNASFLKNTFNNVAKNVNKK